MVRNCMVDSEAAVNIMPEDFMKEMGMKADTPFEKCYAMDNRSVPVVGIMKDIEFRFPACPDTTYKMDVTILQVLVNYGMLLSRQWPNLVGGYVQLDLSYATIPVKGEEASISKPLEIEKIVEAVKHNESLIWKSYFDGACSPANHGTVPSPSAWALCYWLRPPTFLWPQLTFLPAVLPQPLTGSQPPLANPPLAPPCGRRPTGPPLPVALSLHLPAAPSSLIATQPSLLIADFRHPSPAPAAPPLLPAATPRRRRRLPPLRHGPPPQLPSPSPAPSAALALPPDRHRSSTRPPPVHHPLAIGPPQNHQTSFLAFFKGGFVKVKSSFCTPGAIE
ncbi:uncharacterized protein LOC131875149 [Cryptomeria japonica]|uniref:uncharacterized protein LOC131875149 n=1 Tax=Cryptomeria japonica TaxID=3369 RepID=UPI0027DA6AE6|nr:uncharacterized protein LOC131875149 [Cryptomeria japonica]